MIKAKTMTYWENEDYDYPLPDVSHFSKKEAKKLEIKGVEFIIFGHRDQIKSDEEFETCITLAAQWNWQDLAKKSKIEYEEMVMYEVKHNRFLWYHGRYLQFMREKYLPRLIKKLVETAQNGPLFDGAFLYPLELAKFHCMRAYFSNSFIADENGNFSFKPWIDLCIRLLKHIVKEGRDISDSQALHVNVRNVHDIVDCDEIETYINAPMPSEKKEWETDKAWYGRKIYVRKMERLYYKIRLYKMQDWWEP